MFENIKELVKTLVKLKITANQFLLCYLLHVDDRENGFLIKKGDGLASIYRYASVNKWTSEEIIDLIDKGFVINNNKPGKYDPDFLQVTEAFTSQMFAGFDRFWELHDIYPKTLQLSSGGRFKTTATDLDELAKRYNHIIKTQAAHQSVLNITKRAIENNLINTNLFNYVTGRLWDSIAEEEQKTPMYVDNMNVPR